MEIAEQIKIAAADKDVRENSALEAARESLGKLEAQIKELETVLSKSQIVSEKTVKNRISIGSQVLLQETTTKKSSTFTIQTLTSSERSVISENGFLPSLD